MIDLFGTRSRRQVAVAVGTLWPPVLACLFLFCLARPVDARSSFTARFAEVVAGPGIEQTARLVLDYFPGDGEAIVGVQARTDSPDAQFIDVASGRGQTTLAAGGFDLDYRARAIGQHMVDTVAVRLLTPAQSLRLAVELLTNTDTIPTIAHRATATLDIIAPLPVRLELEPRRVYPGESVELQLRASLTDGDSRTMDSVAVRWPSGIHPVGRPRRSVDGGTIVHQQPVRVGRSLAGTQSLIASATGAGLRESPVAATMIEVGVVPVFGIDILGDDPRQDELVRLRLHWTNESDVLIPARSLGATAVAGFTGVRLVPGPEAGGEAPRHAGGVRLQADEEKGGVEVVVDDDGDLAPGSVVVVELELTPVATGPLTFAGRFQPADRMMPVPVGTAVVQVVTREPLSPSPTLLTRTDLELARAGLEPELRRALMSLPLPRGAAVQLSESHSDDGNWVVAGLLTDLLLARGIGVLTDSAAAAVLHYRLADARVIYSPAGSSWNLFADRQRRDARMEVLLRLEDTAGHVRWVQRVTSRHGESAAPASAAWLGGAKGVNQVSVAADHRAIEIGLSGMIVGGLFFVFFAP